MTGRKFSFIAGGQKIKPLFTGVPQEKSKVGQDAQILDEGLENFKKPNIDNKITSSSEMFLHNKYLSDICILLYLR